MERASEPATRARSACRTSAWGSSRSCSRSPTPAGREPDPVQPVQVPAGAGRRLRRAQRRAQGLQPARHRPGPRGQHLRQLAKSIGRTPAQVLLRWGVQRELVVIPKSVNRERIQENSQIFDFRLSEEDDGGARRARRNGRYRARPRGQVVVSARRRDFRREEAWRLAGRRRSLGSWQTRAAPSWLPSFRSRPPAWGRDPPTRIRSSFAVFRTCAAWRRTDRIARRSPTMRRPVALCTGGCRRRLTARASACRMGTGRMCWTGRADGSPGRCPTAVAPCWSRRSVQTAAQVATIETIGEIQPPPLGAPYPGLLSEMPICFWLARTAAGADRRPHHRGHGMARRPPAAR